MKVQITMKDPDRADDACKAAAEASIGVIDDADEREAIVEIRAKKARELASRWFEYGEYLTVEIDTDAQTCVVVPVRK